MFRHYIRLFLLRNLNQTDLERMVMNGEIVHSQSLNLAGS